MIIRKYKEGDEKQIIALLKLVFKSPIFDNAQYWNWMYRSNPTNKMVVWVAEDNGMIVGHNAAIPFLMKIDNKVQLGTLELNSAVHPNYQGQGLFTLLAKRLYDELLEEGIALTYGYPNEKMLPIRAKKLDWFEISTLPVLFKPFDFKGLIISKVRNRFVAGLIIRLPISKRFPSRKNRRKKYEPQQKIDIKKVYSFDDRFEAFWNEVSKAYKIITVRDKKYMTWRYLDNPNYNYEIYLGEKKEKILGYIVLRLQTDKHINEGIVVDLLTLPDQRDVTSALIAKAIGYFKKKEANRVICYIQSQYYYELLRQEGFMPIPYRIYRPKFGARVDTPINKQFITSSSNWFLTNGDRSNEI